MSGAKLSMEIQHGGKTSGISFGVDDNPHELATVRIRSLHLLENFSCTDQQCSSISSSSHVVILTGA